MKFISAVWLMILIALAAVCPRAAEANVIVKVPKDPVDCNTTLLPKVQVFTNGTETDNYIIVNDGITAESDFANCTGGTIGKDFTNGLFVVIYNVPTTPPNPPTQVFLQGNDFDTLMPVSLPSALSTFLVNNELVTGSLIEEEAFCSNYPTGCPGMQEGDVGAALTPEPTEAVQLLFGLGIIFFGFGGWKRRQKIGSTKTW